MWRLGRPSPWAGGSGKLVIRPVGGDMWVYPHTIIPHKLRIALITGVIASNPSIVKFRATSKKGDAHMPDYWGIFIPAHLQHLKRTIIGDL